MCILLLVGQRQKLNPRMLLFCAFFAADVAAAAVVRMAVSESERFIHAVQVQFTVLRIQMLSLSGALARSLSYRARFVSYLTDADTYVAAGVAAYCFFPSPLCSKYVALYIRSTDVM